MYYCSASVYKTSGNEGTLVQSKALRRMLPHLHLQKLWREGIGTAVLLLSMTGLVVLLEKVLAEVAGQVAPN